MRACESTGLFFPKMIGFWLSLEKNTQSYFFPRNIVTIYMYIFIHVLLYPQQIRIFNKHKKILKWERSYFIFISTFYYSSKPLSFVLTVFPETLFHSFIFFLIYNSLFYLPYLFITDFSFIKGSLTIITLNSDGFPDKEDTFALFFSLLPIIPQGSIPPSRRLKDARIPYKKIYP